MAYIPFLHNAYFAAKVGIGTDSPDAKLQISAANASSPTANIFLDIDGTNTTGMGGEIIFGTSASGTLLNYNAKIAGVRSGLGNGSSDIHFQTTHVATATTPSTKMTILSGGNVGIGTVSPGSKLTINETSTATAAVNIVTARYGISLQGAGATSNSQYLLNLQSDGGAKEVMRVQSSGNVGIGTTSPGSILELAAATPILTLNSTAVNVAQGIEWKNSGTLDAYIKQGPSSAEFEFNVGRNATWGGDFKFVTDTYDAYRITKDQHKFFILGSTKMTINSAGNVGIGTTSPSTRLEVAASATTSVDIAHFSNSNDVVKIKHALDGLGSGITSIFDASNNEDIRLSAQSNSWFNAGNVGIGTVSPDSLLEISKAQASGPILKITEPTTINGTLEGGPGNNLGVLGFVSADTSTSQANLIRASVEGQPGEKPYGTGGMLTFNTMQTYSGSGTLTDLIERMRITSTGNVGIGTVDPDSKLHVLQSGNGTSSLIITEDNARKIKIGRDSIQVTDLSDSGTNLYLNQGGGNVSIPNSGLVVGATGITYKFEVHSGATNVTSMFKSTDNQAWISIQDDDSGTYGALIGTDSDEGENFVVANNSVTKMLSITNSGSVKFHNYNSSNQTGTPTYLLGTDASGNVVKTLSSTAPGSLWLASGNNIYNANSANVGIGLSGPETDLMIYDTVSEDPAEPGYATTGMFALNRSGQATLSVGVNSANVYWMSNVNRAFTGPNYYNISLNPLGGKVGIGTTSASKQFTVRSFNNSTTTFAGFYALNESQGLEIGYAGIYSGGTNADVDMNIQAKGTGNILMTGSGNVGIGNTGPNYKLTVAGGIEAGGVVTYSKVAGSLDTTGYAIAGLGTVFNGASAFFTFTASGGTGQYQRIVYSCAGVGTNWVVYKVIDEGTNVLDIEASATSAATIVFTFKTRSGTQAYSPRVVIEATGHSIISTYA
jgi:hypothetical protein